MLSHNYGAAHSISVSLSLTRLYTLCYAHALQLCSSLTCNIFPMCIYIHIHHLGLFTDIIALKGTLTLFANIVLSWFRSIRLLFESMSIWVFSHNRIEQSVWHLGFDRDVHIPNTLSLKTNVALWMDWCLKDNTRYKCIVQWHYYLGYRLMQKMCGMYVSRMQGVKRCGMYDMVICHFVQRYSFIWRVMIGGLPLGSTLKWQGLRSDTCFFLHHSVGGQYT